MRWWKSSSAFIQANYGPKSHMASMAIIPHIPSLSRGSCGLRPHMLRPHSEADKPRRNAAQERPIAQQTQRQGQRRRPGAGEHAADDPVLDEDLGALGQ